MKYLSIIFILIFRISVFAQAPDWSVNPNEYEYSMSFSGVVSIDTVENTNTSSKIAAWVGDELRGTADPVYVTATGRYYYLLLVYANTVGETIEFTFYNADTDEVVDIIKEETFVSDKNFGSFSEPYVFKNWENYLFNEFVFTGFDAEAEVDTTGKQIAFTLPANSDPTNLVAVFRFDDATSIKVNGVEQQSGITANDFTAPVEYVVTTPNNTHTWTVNVTAEEVEEEEEENDLFNEFAFAGFDVEAEIDTTGKQIAFTLPANSDLTSLVAVFQFDDATSIKVNGMEQQSGITANDFTNPVEYVVTTPNNTHTWTVNVTVEEVEEEEENSLFNEFAFAGFDAVAEIDTITKQIAFTLPANSDPTSLVAVFQFDNATSIKVNGMEQQSGITVNDFTNPVEYIVATPNNTYTWTVNVTVEEVEEEEENSLFNEFAFAGFDAVAEIDTITKQIAFTLPANSDPTSLVAVFQFDDATSIKVNGVEQQSGITANDFTTPVEYLVTTPNNTHTWTVNVTVEETDEEPTITDIEDVDSDAELVLYPNPAQNILNIKSSSKILEYEIFNNCGVLTLRGELLNGIDVKHLPTGTYFIRIITENDDISVKRWVKH